MRVLVSSNLRDWASAKVSSEAGLIRHAVQVWLILAKEIVGLHYLQRHGN